MKKKSEAFPVAVMEVMESKDGSPEGKWTPFDVLTEYDYPSFDRDEISKCIERLSKITGRKYRLRFGIVVYAESKQETPRDDETLWLFIRERKCAWTPYQPIFDKRVRDDPFMKESYARQALMGFPEGTEAAFRYCTDYEDNHLL